MADFNHRLMFDLIFHDRDGLSPPQTETRLQWQGGQLVSLRDLVVAKARAQRDAASRGENGLSLVARLDPDSLQDAVLMAVEQACSDVNKGGVIVMVDGRQITDLDALIDLRPTTRIEFLRLIPMQGG